MRRYSLEILDWLLGQGVKAVVVACNTSTAHALETLQEHSPVPVIGVIEPGARAAVRRQPRRPIGVIGTAGTIASGAYARAIQALGARSARWCSGPVRCSCRWWRRAGSTIPATELIAREYLEPLCGRPQVDTLVLGCTHYPLLKPLLQRVMGPEVRAHRQRRGDRRAVVGHVLGGNQLAAPDGRSRDAPVRRE